MEDKEDNVKAVREESFRILSEDNIKEPGARWI